MLGAIGRGRSAVLRLLGAERDPRLHAVTTVKALDLLTLLAVDVSAWRCGDHYVDLLWPDADAERGRSSLRTALAQLRRVLGGHAIERTGELVHLGELRTDVAELRTAMAAVAAAAREGADHEVVRLASAAQAAYPGDLVVSATSCDAAYAARDELREARATMLVDAAAAAARLGWMRESLGFARAADARLSNEVTGRALMRALAGLGETGSAIDVFERLRGRLAEEYGVDPSPATRALYLQLLSSGSGSELRPAEWHADAAVELADALRSLRSGGVVWVHGEPGAGRGTVIAQATRLLDDVPAYGPGSIDVLPELVGLDLAEMARLRAEAERRGCVLVVPVRADVVCERAARDRVVRVGRLDRGQLYDLLCQVLQERPTRRLAGRVWTASGGLAGQACRTVALLVRDDRVVWTPAGMDLRTEERMLARVRESASRVHRIWVTPAVVDLAAWASPAESSVARLLVA